MQNTQRIVKPPNHHNINNINLNLNDNDANEHANDNENDIPNIDNANPNEQNENENENANANDTQSYEFEHLIDDAEAPSKRKRKETIYESPSLLVNEDKDPNESKESKESDEKEKEKEIICELEQKLRFIQKQLDYYKEMDNDDYYDDDDDDDDNDSDDTDDDDDDDVSDDNNNEENANENENNAQNNVNNEMNDELSVILESIGFNQPIDDFVWHQITWISWFCGQQISHFVIPHICGQFVFCVIYIICFAFLPTDHVITRLCLDVIDINGDGVHILSQWLCYCVLITIGYLSAMLFRRILSYFLLIFLTSVRKMARNGNDYSRITLYLLGEGYVWFFDREDITKGMFFLFLKFVLFPFILTFCLEICLLPIRDETQWHQYWTMWSVVLYGNSVDFVTVLSAAMYCLLMVLWVLVIICIYLGIIDILKEKMRPTSFTYLLRSVTNIGNWFIPYSYQDIFQEQLIKWCKTTVHFSLVIFVFIGIPSEVMSYCTVIVPLNIPSVGKFESIQVHKLLFQDYILLFSVLPILLFWEPLFIAFIKQLFVFLAYLFDLKFYLLRQNGLDNPDRLDVAIWHEEQPFMDDANINAVQDDIIGNADNDDADDDDDDDDDDGQNDDELYDVYDSGDAIEQWGCLIDEDDRDGGVDGDNDDIMNMVDGCICKLIYDVIGMCESKEEKECKIDETECKMMSSDDILLNALLFDSDTFDIEESDYECELIEKYWKQFHTKYDSEFEKKEETMLLSDTSSDDDDDFPYEPPVRVPPPIHNNNNDRMRGNEEDALDMMGLFEGVDLGGNENVIPVPIVMNVKLDNFGKLIKIDVELDKYPYKSKENKTEAIHDDDHGNNDHNNDDNDAFDDEEVIPTDDELQQLMQERTDDDNNGNGVFVEPELPAQNNAENVINEQKAEEEKEEKWHVNAIMTKTNYYERKELLLDILELCHLLYVSSEKFYFIYNHNTAMIDNMDPHIRILKNAKHLISIDSVITLYDRIWFYFKLFLFFVFFVIVLNSFHLILFLQCLVYGRKLWKMLSSIPKMLLFDFGFNFTRFDQMGYMSFVFNPSCIHDLHCIALSIWWFPTMHAIINFVYKSIDGTFHNGISFRSLTLKNALFAMKMFVIVCIEYLCLPLLFGFTSQFVLWSPLFVSCNQSFCLSFLEGWIEGFFIWNVISPFFFIDARIEEYKRQRLVDLEFVKSCKCVWWPILKKCIIHLFVPFVIVQSHLFAHLIFMEFEWINVKYDLTDNNNSNNNKSQLMLVFNQKYYLKYIMRRILQIRVFVNYHSFLKRIAGKVWKKFIKDRYVVGKKLVNYYYNKSD